MALIDKPLNCLYDRKEDQWGLTDTYSIGRPLFFGPNKLLLELATCNLNSLIMLEEKILNQLNAKKELKNSLVLDIEASGFEGSCIEIGWGQPDNLIQSYLVQRNKEYHDDTWSAESEDIHGISLKMLEDQGEPPEKIIDALEASNCRTLFFESCSFDRAWLSTLYEMAGKQTMPRFDIEPIARFYFLTLRASVEDKEWKKRVPTTIEVLKCVKALLEIIDEDEEALGPRGHRAEADIERVLIHAKKIRKLGSSLQIPGVG